MHIQSLREELELSHAYQQQFQSRLTTVRDQLMALVNSDTLNDPGPHSALVSVLAVLECALQSDIANIDQQGV